MIKWKKKDVLEAATTMVSPFEKQSGQSQRMDLASVAQELRRTLGKPQPAPAKEV